MIKNFRFIESENLVAIKLPVSFFDWINRLVYNPSSAEATILNLSILIIILFIFIPPFVGKPIIHYSFSKSKGSIC